MTQKYILIESASAMPAETLSYIKDLDQDHFPTPWGSETWDKIFNSVEQRFILVAEADGIVMGFALIDTNAADSFAHLLKIVVGPNVRGMGFGKNLLSESVRILKERDIKTFFLEVEEHNSVALNLYEQMGFKIIHQKKQYYSSGATALIMTLSV